MKPDPDTPGAGHDPPLPADGGEALLRAALDALPSGAFGVNPRGRVVLWNAAMAELAAPADRALGRPLADVLAILTDPMRSADFEALILKEALKRGRASFVEAYPLRRRDGAVKLFDVRIVPIESPAGGRAGAICLWEDVTERLQKTRQDLRNARTSSLASFGASIAHEIRNPLNSIALNLQLLREGLSDLEGPAKEDLLDESKAILEEIENLNRVVGSLLKFARDPAPALDTGDALEAVERALRLLAGEARKSNVRIERDLGALPGVHLDEDMLSRAIYNIALNAIQAMPGGGTLTVRTEARPHSALIELADTGPGISAEERERIFDLFYSRRSGGSGVGLPIAHRIVEGHGGRITVEDAPGGGAAFQIHLPWASSPPADGRGRENR